MRRAGFGLRTGCSASRPQHRLHLSTLQSHGQWFRPRDQLWRLFDLARPGGFHKFTIDPGTFHCDVHTEVTTQVEIDAKPGQQYYIRESIWPGWILAHVHLDVKDPDQAQAEIQQCKVQ